MRFYRLLGRNVRISAEDFVLRDQIAVPMDMAPIPVKDVSKLFPAGRRPARGRGPARGGGRSDVVLVVPGQPLRGGIHYRFFRKLVIFFVAFQVRLKYL